MKKVLLSVMAIFASLVVKAQYFDNSTFTGLLQVTPALAEDTLMVKLEISQINDTAWQWNMLMGSSIRKNYSIHRSKSDTSKWTMDEGNGIILSGCLSGNQLHFMYSLDYIFYTVVYTFSNEIIDFQIHYYDIKKAKPSVSGEFTIYDYPIKGRQFARLHKVL